MNQPTEPNYLCLDCNGELTIPDYRLQDENDVVAVKCDCGKHFILGLNKDYEGNLIAFTYPLYDGPSIIPALSRLLINTAIPVNIIDELMKFATLNRWAKFKELVKRYSTKIGTNIQLVTFLTENLIY